MQIKFLLNLIPGNNKTRFYGLGFSLQCREISSRVIGAGGESEAEENVCITEWNNSLQGYQFSLNVFGDE